jgi:hypothetical protein
MGPGTTKMEPEPGWFAKRRRTLPPADDLLADLPFGPVLEPEGPAGAINTPAAAGHYQHEAVS